MAGGDRNSAGGLVVKHGQLHGRRRDYADIDHLASRHGQSGNDQAGDKFARWPAVAADHDLAFPEEPPECGGISHDCRGIERHADDPADTRR
jgi:hypothetical protein